MQIGVEAGYVVHCQAFQNRNDVGTLKPFLERWKELHPTSSSYYKVVVFIVPLQGLNAIILTDAVD